MPAARPAALEPEPGHDAVLERNVAGHERAVDQRGGDAETHRVILTEDGL